MGGWISKFFICSAVIVILLIQFLAGMRGYPGFRHDGFVFQPPIITYSQDKTLINNAWVAARYIDPQGIGRYVYHGILYPMFVGSLMWSPDYPTAFKVACIIIITQQILFITLFLLLRRSGQISTRFQNKYIFLLVFLTNALYISFLINGRPEILCSTIVTIVLFGLILLPVSKQHFIAGPGIGLVAAASPISGIFSGLTFAVYIFMKRPFPSAVKTLLFSFIMFIAFFLLVFCFYPYSIKDWSIGFYRTSQHALSIGGVKAVAFYISHMAIVVPLILSCFTYIFLTRSLNITRASKLSASLVWVLLILSIWRFCIYSPRIYNFSIFIPIFSLILVWMHAMDKQKYKTMVEKIYSASILIWLFICSLGCVYYLIHQTNFLLNGNSIYTAREDYKEIIKNPEDIVLVDRFYYWINENYENIRFESGRHKVVDPDWIILRQKSFSVKPPTMEKYKLIKDRFQRKSPFPAFIDNIVLRYPRGFNYAIYRRIDHMKEASP